MQFDSSRAWREAMAAVNANREVLLTVGGVFFLLPALGSAMFLTDIQQSMMASFGDPAASQRVMDSIPPSAMGLGLLSLLLQLVGYMALLALLTDRARPTVAEAMLIAVKSLPTLIGTVALFFAGYLVVTLVYALFAGVLGAALGQATVVAALVLLFLILMVATAIRLSLTMPVIVIEKTVNPAAALLRSWHLTRGNGFRLFGFYLLLMLVYFVIVIAAGSIAMGITTLAAGQGKVTALVGALVSGLFGTAASVLLVAILAAVHRQLAGPSAEALDSTFG